MNGILQGAAAWGARQNAHAVRSAAMFLPVILFAGSMIIGAAVLILQWSHVMPKPNTFSVSTLAGVVVLFGAVIVTALAAASIWARWLGHQGIAFIGMDGRYRQFFIGMIWGTGLQLSLLAIQTASGWLTIDGINIESRAIINVLIITASSLNIGVVEEVLYRGVLFAAFRRHWTWWPTALVTGVLFVIPHFIVNRNEFPISAGLGLLTGGVLFAWVRELAGTLWTPTGVHVAWDAAIGWFNLSARTSPHILATTFHAPRWIVGEWGVTDWIAVLAFAVSIWLVRMRRDWRMRLAGQR